MEILTLLDLVLKADEHIFRVDIGLSSRTLHGISIAQIAELFGYAAQSDILHQVYANSAGLKLLGYQHLEYIFEAIACNASLKKLVFYGQALHRFTESQLAVMCRPLNNCTGLHEIQFCDNNLSFLNDIHLRIIFNQLARNPSLCCINLSHNILRQFTSRQLCAMWNPLSQSQSLRCLDVSETGLQEDDLQELCVSDSLVEIKGVALSSDGALATALRENRHRYFMPGAVLYQICQQRLAIQTGPIIDQLQSCLGAGAQYGFKGKMQQTFRKLGVRHACL